MDTDHFKIEFSHQGLALDSHDPTAASQACHQAHRFRLEWHHIIATIALRMRRSLHLPEILQTSVDEVRQLLGCDRVLIYKFAPDWSGQVIYESLSSSQWSLLNRVVHDAYFESSWISPYPDGHFFACADISQADLTPCHVEMLQSLQVKANLVVPIGDEDQLWGLMVAHHCTAAYAWNVEQIDGLQQIAVHIGIAVHQAALIEQLQATNALLETQVQERTDLLEWTNQDLLEAVYEHRQVTDTVFQQTQFWCQVLDSLFTFVGVLSPEGQLLEVNQAPLTVAGLTRGEVLGKPFADAYWWDYDATAPAKIREAIAQARQGTTVQFDIPVQIKDGDQLMVDVSFIPLRDDTGIITYVIYSGTDITERQRTEAILRKSEATNQALIKAVPDFLVRMRQDGIQMNVINQGMVHCLHPDPSLFDERSVLQVMPTPIAQERIELAQRAIATQQAQRQEYQFELAGETYYEEARIVPLWEDEVLVVVRDITEQKQAELRLHATKEQLELFIQATSEGFWDWNLVTNAMYLSPRWKEMLGYGDDELPNTVETWQSMMVEGDRQQLLQLIEGYNSGHISEFKATQRFQHKDGSVVHMLVRAIHLQDEQGQVVRMVGSHLDMTATVAMQMALKTSELQLSSILNSSLDGIMAFRSVRDDQGQIVDFEWLLSNTTACDMVGCLADTLIGQRLLDEMRGNRDEDLFNLYLQVVESGEPVQRQFHFNEDGFDRWFEAIAVKLEDGLVVTFRNITAVKQSEQALQRANRQLEENINDLKQRNLEMRLLSETSDFLQACRSIDEACAVITSLVEPLFPYCAGGIFITNPSRNRAENVAIWGDRLHSRPEFPPHECWALRRGRSHWVSNNRAGLRCDHILQSGGRNGEPPHGLQDVMVDTLCIPMVAQGETLGLFYLSSSAPMGLSDSKQQLAQTVAEQIGLAIANLRLRETLHYQSIRDPLTGLFNRRYLEESLERELIRAQRKQHPIGLIMVDLDHFKHFNDTYGHDAGDRVLQTISKLIRDNIRGSDIACRYGGEELTLVLPESSLSATATRAETLRQSISHLQLKHNNHRLENLTASFGVSCFPQHGIVGSALIQAADAALYQAKSAGRNQVIVAT